MKKSFYVHLCLLIFLDLVTALTARLAHESGQAWPLVVSIGAICLAAPVFMKLLKEELTAVVSILWIGGGVLAVAASSFLLFGETLSGRQTGGILLMTVGLILTQFHPSKQHK